MSFQVSDRYVGYILNKSENTIRALLASKQNKANESVSECYFKCLKIVSEYDQEIPQSQTADNPVAPRGRAAQLSRGTRKTN